MCAFWIFYIAHCLNVASHEIIDAQKENSTDSNTTDYLLFAQDYAVSMPLFDRFFPWNNTAFDIVVRICFRNLCKVCFHYIRFQLWHINFYVLLEYLAHSPIERNWICEEILKLMCIDNTIMLDFCKWIWILLLSMINNSFIPIFHLNHW